MNKFLHLIGIDSNVVINFFWRTVQIAAKQGVTFLIFLLCAHSLNVYDLGVFSYAFTIVLFLTLIGDFGISIAISRYVAHHASVSDLKKAELVAFNSVLFSTLLLLIIIIISFLLRNIFFKEIYNYILLLTPCLLFSPLSSIFDGLYRGLKKFKDLTIISLGTCIISLPVIYFLVKYYGLTGALVSQNLFYGVLLLGLVLGLRDFKFEKKIDYQSIKEVAFYAAKVGLINVGYFLYLRTDILMLGWFNYISEVAYYEVITRFFLILLLPISLFSTVLAPDVTKLFKVHDFYTLKKNLKKQLLSIFLFTSVASIVLYFFANFIFSTFFSQYDIHLLSQMFLLILVILPVRYMSSLIENAYIIPGGIATALTISTIVFGIISIFSDYFILSHNLGVIYILASTLIVQFFSFIFVVAYLFHKIIKLKTGNPS